MIRDTATGLRTYVVLDCCYAGSATKGFLNGGPVGAAMVQLHDSLPPQGDTAALRRGRPPEYGTALLCASGPRERARAPAHLSHTMFTGGLLAVLQHGDITAPAWLSLSDIQWLVRTHLEAKFANEAVLPQLHVPQQRMGRLDMVPLFPNPARRTEDSASLLSINGEDQFDAALQTSDEGSMSHRWANAVKQRLLQKLALLFIAASIAGFALVSWINSVGPSLDHRSGVVTPAASVASDSQSEPVENTLERLRALNKQDLAELPRSGEQMQGQSITIPVPPSALTPPKMVPKALLLSPPIVAVPPSSTATAPSQTNNFTTPSS
jgi:hypothetical protein